MTAEKSGNESSGYVVAEGAAALCPAPLCGVDRDSEAWAWPAESDCVVACASMGVAMQLNNTITFVHRIILGKFEELRLNETQRCSYCTKGLKKGHAIS